MGKAAGHFRMVLAAVAAGMVLVGLAGAARADDGIGGFFQQIFGGPAAQPTPGEPVSPPLTVRMHKHRRPTGAHYASNARQDPNELKRVTIYTDKTLVRGDAVMTPAGVVIFNGSPSWPYQPGDFVALSATSKLPKLVRKELIAIDVAARSDHRGE